GSEFSNDLNESMSIVENLLQQVRDLSLDLRPLVLDDLGLAAALRWYLSRQAKLSGFLIHFTENLGTSPLPSEVQTTCFRIAKEALTNVVRHSHAKLVNMELKLHRGELNLLIKDDGVGFDMKEILGKSAEGGCLGLVGMQERAALLGGRIEIESF